MKAVYQWVLRTMMKDQTGVMQTLPKKDLVDFNVAMTAERLMRNGIDPNALKNANQVENAINQIEAPRNVQKGIKSTDSAKVFDMEGKEIPKGSKIMGGKQAETEAEIAARISKENKESAARIKNKKMVDDAIDNASPGFSGDTKYDAELVAEDLAERMGLVYDDLPTKQRLDLYDQAYTGLSKQRFKNKPEPEDMAQGGRAGYKFGLGPLFNFLNKKSPMKAYTDYLESVKTRMKAGKEAEVAGEVIPIAAGGALITNQLKKKLKKMNEDQKKKIEQEAQEELRKDMKKADGGIMRLGLKEGSGMTRRTFLKFLAGAASIPIVGKFLKPMKIGKTVTKVPMIKTDNVAGKPEWFDALVNKVIMEGDDVTKKFATAERQSIHQKTLDDGSVVRVTEDVDDGAVRVEYESEQNTFADTVQLEYKKPLPDEGAPDPAAEFTTAESGPVGRSQGPDDYDIDVDEVGGSSISDLDSDVSKLKEYATGKKLTMKEFIQSKKRKDRAKAISEDMEAQSDAVIRRQGDADDSYYAGSNYGDVDDYASGGIARMLGE
jgi:hypothetical protein